MKNERLDHLEELDHSDYKIAEDQPNIENWKILETSGKKVGKVKDLIFDKDAMKVRYIVTNLKDGDLLREDKKVLIPIGRAQLDRENNRVVVPGLDRERLASLPTYKKVDDLTRDDESRIRNSFGGTTAVEYESDNFYEHEDYDEERFYAHGMGEERRDMDSGRSTSEKVDVVEEDLEVGKKEVDTGGKRVTSRIVERPVEERVRLKEERVNVKRNPVDRPADSTDLDKNRDRTIEEHESQEVPVAKKEARVVEEVSLEKDVDTREEAVKEDVRRTEVDVEDLEGREDRSGINQTERNQDGDVPGRKDLKSDRTTDSGIAGKDDIRNRERTRGKDKKGQNL